MSEEGKILVGLKAILTREDGKILALRRSSYTHRRPLEWDLPGGMLEYGEDVNEAIRREIREETGLEVADLRLLDLRSGFNYLKEFFVSIAYTARPVSTDVTLSDEHIEHQWVTPEEFNRLKTSPMILRFVALSAGHAAPAKP